jgi:hypothetical protein
MEQPQFLYLYSRWTQGSIEATPWLLSASGAVIRYLQYVLYNTSVRTGHCATQGPRHAGLPGRMIANGLAVCRRLGSRNAGYSLGRNGWYLRIKSNDSKVETQYLLLFGKVFKCTDETGRNDVERWYEHDLGDTGPQLCDAGCEACMVPNLNDALPGNYVMGGSLAPISGRS